MVRTESCAAKDSLGVKEPLGAFPGEAITAAYCSRISGFRLPVPRGTAAETKMRTAAVPADRKARGQPCNSNSRGDSTPAGRPPPKA